MKKKIITCVLACIMSFACSAFVACGKDVCVDDGQTHTHTLEEHAHRDPLSCKENGNIQYWECSGCGGYFRNSDGTDEYEDKSEVIIAGQHNPEIIFPTQPSCIEKGNIQYWECNDCHTCFADRDATQVIAKDSVYIAELGHNYEIMEAHSDQAACNVSGWNEYHVCTRCSFNTMAGFYGPHVLRSYTDDTYGCGNCGMDLTGTAGLEFALSADGQSYAVSGIGTALAALSDSKEKVIVIPRKHNGMPVTAVGENAFKDCETITEVVIPSGVASIGQRAFYGCIELLIAEIPETVTEIGKEAFSHCENLEYVIIPNGVTKISEGAFSNCLKLKSAALPAGVTAIEKSAFELCRSLLRIDFGGTKYQWDAVKKADTWDKDTEAGGLWKVYFVYCTEGAFDAFGDEIKTSQAG